MFGIHDLPLFIVSGLLLNVMPGPDSLLIMTRGATQGWRAGCMAVAGITAGVFVHILAAALGLSAILATSANAFMVVKLAGAAYILYLAFGLLRSRQDMQSERKETKPAPYRRIFLQGFLTNVLNPKVAIFFLAFVPQFISADSTDKTAAFLVLGCLFNFNSLFWNIFLAISSAFTSERIKLSPRISTWLNRITGGLFVWLGIKLALSKQS